MSSSGSGGTPRSCNTVLHWKTATFSQCGQFSEDKTAENHLKRCSLLWNSLSLDKNSIYNLLKDFTFRVGRTAVYLRFLRFSLS